VVEQAAAALPAGGQIGFCRTTAGAELDLVVESPARRVDVEIKFSASPKPTKGFIYQAGFAGIDDRARLRRRACAAALSTGSWGGSGAGVWDIDGIVGEVVNL
jgi:hypothetical protein